MPDLEKSKEVEISSPTSRDGTIPGTPVSSTHQTPPSEADLENEQHADLEQSQSHNPIDRIRSSSRPEVFTSTLQEVLTVLCCTAAVAATSLTTGSITVTSSFIARDLHMNTAEITWLSAAASLASGSFLLLFARIADLFGRRTLFVASMLVYALLILGAGFAKNAITLDILSGLSGLASAACVPPAQGLLSVAYARPSARRNAAFACFSAGNPLGFVMGIVSGGVVSQIFNWRASFWWLALINIVFTVTAWFVLPKEDGIKRANWSKETARRFDVGGSVLAILGTGFVSAGLSLGSDAPKGWKTAYVLVLLVLGVACIAGFIVWELYHPYPLIPMSIFRNRNLCLLLSCLCLGFIGFPASSFWVSLYLQRVWHYSALQTAVHMLPMAIGGILFNVVAALILHRISNKLIMFIGALGYPISFMLYALHKTSYGYWPMIFPGLVLAVLGADLQFNVVNMYVMSSLPREQQSIASGLFQTLTRLCLTIGMAGSTAVYDGVAAQPADKGWHAGDPVKPYSAVWWFSFSVAAIGLPLVPFLKIGTQGKKRTVEKVT